MTGVKAQDGQVLVEPEGWRSADDHDQDERTDMQFVYLSCEQHGFCPHWPKAVLHALHDDKDCHQWWYESVCCRARKPIYNLPRRYAELIRALRQWEHVGRLVAARRKPAPQMAMEL